MNGHQKQKEWSRKSIQKALFELMGEKDFSQITVSEIVERADVGRRTFYRLYGGKMEVLRSYFCELCQEYEGNYEPLEKYDIGRIAEEYFGFWYQYREFLLLMHQCGMDDMLYYELSRASWEVVRKRIGSEMLRCDPKAEYFATYSAGGFLNLLHRWILEGMQGTAEEYAENVRESLLAYLK